VGFLRPKALPVGNPDRTTGTTPKGLRQVGSTEPTASRPRRQQRPEPAEVGGRSRVGNRNEETTGRGDTLAEAGRETGRRDVSLGRIQDGPDVPIRPRDPRFPVGKEPGLVNRDTRSEHHGVASRHRNTRPREARGRGRKPRGREGKKRSQGLEREEGWTGSPAEDATHTTHRCTHFQYPSASKNGCLRGHLIPGSSGKVMGMPVIGDQTSQPDTCIPTRERDPDEYIIKGPSRPPANEKGEEKCRCGPSPEQNRPSSTTVGPMHTH
jgi:hypothetical protein